MSSVSGLWLWGSAKYWQYFVRWHYEYSENQSSLIMRSMLGLYALRILHTSTRSTSECNTTAVEYLGTRSLSGFLTAWLGELLPVTGSVLYVDTASTLWQSTLTLSMRSILGVRRIPRPSVHHSSKMYTSIAHTPSTCSICESPVLQYYKYILGVQNVFDTQSILGVYTHSLVQSLRGASVENIVSFSFCIKTRGCQGVEGSHVRYDVSKYHILIYRRHNSYGVRVYVSIPISGGLVVTSTKNALY